MSIIGEAVGLARPEPWTAQANCIGTDPEAFHPEPGGSTKEAKVICSRCDVRAECLAMALRNDERFGVFGGFSERERRRILRGEVVEFKVGRRRELSPQVCGHCGSQFSGHAAAVYCCPDHRRAAQLARHNARRRGEAA